MDVAEVLKNAGFDEAEIPLVATVLDLSSQQEVDSALIRDVEQFLRGHRENTAFKTIVDKIATAFGIEFDKKIEALTPKPAVSQNDIANTLLGLLMKSVQADLDLHPYKYKLEFKITPEDLVPKGLCASLEALCQAYGLIKDNELDRLAVLKLQNDYYVRQKRGEDISAHKYEYILTLIKQIVAFKAVADFMKDNIDRELSATPIGGNKPFEKSVASGAIDVILDSAARLLPDVLDKDNIGDAVGYAVEAALRQAYGIPWSKELWQGILDRKIDLKRLSKLMSAFGPVSPGLAKIAKNVRVSETAPDTLSDLNSKIDALSGYGEVEPVKWLERKPSGEGEKTEDEKRRESAIEELSKKYGSNKLRTALSMLGAPLAGIGGGISLSQADKILREVPELSNFGMPLPEKMTRDGAVPIDTAKELMASLDKYSGKDFFNAYGSFSGTMPDGTSEVFAGALSRGMARRPTPEMLNKLTEKIRVGPSFPDSNTLASVGYPYGKNLLEMPLNVATGPHGRIAEALKGLPPESLNRILGKIGRDGAKGIMPFAGISDTGIQRVRQSLGIPPSMQSELALRTVIAEGGDGALNRIRNTVLPKGPIDNLQARQNMQKFIDRQRAIRAMKPSSSLGEAYAKQNPEYLKAIARQRFEMDQALVEQEKAKQKGKVRVIIDEAGAQAAERFITKSAIQLAGLPGSVGKIMVGVAQKRLLGMPFPEGATRFSYEHLKLGKAGKVVEQFFPDAVREARVANIIEELKKQARGNSDELDRLLRERFLIRNERVKLTGKGLRERGEPVHVTRDDLIDFSAKFSKLANSMSSALGPQGQTSLGEAVYAERLLVNAQNYGVTGKSINQLGLGSLGALAAVHLGIDPDSPLSPQQLQEALLFADNITAGLEANLSAKGISIGSLPLGNNIFGAIQRVRVDKPSTPLALYDFLHMLRDSAQQRQIYGVTESDVTAALSVLDKAAGLDGIIGTGDIVQAAGELRSRIAAIDKLSKRGKAIINIAGRTQGLVGFIAGIRGLYISFLHGTPFEVADSISSLLKNASRVIGNNTTVMVSEVLGRLTRGLVNLKNLFQDPGETAERLTKETVKDQLYKLLRKGIQAAWKNVIKPAYAWVAKRVTGFLVRRGVIASAGAGVGAGVKIGGIFSAATSFLAGVNPIVWIVIAVVLVICCLLVCLAGGFFSGIGTIMQESVTSYGSGQAYTESHIYVSKTIPSGGLRRENPSDSTSPVIGTTYEVTLEYDGQFDSDFVIMGITDKLDGLISDYESEINPLSQEPTIRVIAGSAFDELQIVQSDENYSAFTIIDPAPAEYTKDINFKVVFEVGLDFVDGLDDLLAGSLEYQSLCNTVSFKIRYSATGEEQVVSAKSCIAPDGSFIGEICPFVASTGSLYCSQGPFASYSHSDNNAIDINLGGMGGVLEIVSPVAGTVIAVEESVTCSTNKSCSTGGKVVIYGEDGLTYSFYHIDPDGLWEGRRVNAGQYLGKWATDLVVCAGCWTGPHIHAQIDPCDNASCEHNVYCEYVYRFKCNIPKCPSGVVNCAN